MDRTVIADLDDLFDDRFDLQTRVGLAGTQHQAEVGGSVCFNSAISVVIITGD